VACILLALGLLGCSPSGLPPFRHTPELIFDESVGPDFRALAAETWSHFLKVFEARSGCFGDVRLHAAYSLDSRAGYDPDSATVTVHVPGTPAMLKSALVHEWAHHIEFQCNEHKDLRRAFLEAQGLPPDTQWRMDGVFLDRMNEKKVDLPSEQYAEAAIIVVLGSRQIPNGVTVTQEMVRAVEEWAAGE
jgi:hypothetical protein